LQQSRRVRSVSDGPDSLLKCAPSTIWITQGRLRNQAELGLGNRFDPPFYLQALFLRVLQVPQILIEGFLIELEQKLGLGGLVELANSVDQLTFVHGVFTFKPQVARLRRVLQLARSVIVPFSLEPPM
jgi:hypothetical protein